MYPEEKRKGRWEAVPRYQLVETYREGGKVRQRVASLGEHPTIEEALHAFRKSVAGWEAALIRNEQPRNWRAFRRRNKRRAELNVLLGKARNKLARLEAVVSTTSLRTDVLDTTADKEREAGLKLEEAGTQWHAHQTLV
jgi:hypothetical protein